MYESIYKTLSPYDWLVLCRIFLSIGISFSAFLGVSYYVTKKWLFREWSDNSRKKTLYSLIFLSIYFPFTSVWAFGLFDPLELTNFPKKPSAITVILLALLVALFMSILFYFLIKGWEKFIKEHEHHPIAERRRQKRYKKYSQLIRLRNKKLGIYKGENEIAREAEKLSIQRALISIRIVYGILISFFIIFFSPFVLALLLQ